MSVQDFLLPDLGEGLTEAELVSWLVEVGETITVDQPIAELETAKSVVEVPSPFAGVVATRHGQEGDTLAVGSPLLSVATEAAEAPAPVREAEAADSVQDPQEPGTVLQEPDVVLPPAKHDDETSAGLEGRSPESGNGGREPQTGSQGSGNVLIGYGTTGSGGPGRTRPPRRRSAEVPAGSAAGPASANGSRTGTGPATEPKPGTLAAAVVVRSPDAGSPVSGEPDAQPANAGRDRTTGLPVVARTPLTGVQRSASAAFSRSRREIPEATVWVDVDATELLRLRSQVKDSAGSPGLLALIARFTVAGLARFPQLNMRLESDGEGNGPGVQSLVQFDGVNLGVAAQTERGLMVPVIRNAQKLSARSLDGAIRDAIGTARAGKAGPADLTGSTFTINNYGVLGVDGSAAIINYPEAGMLGIGRLLERPWVVAGELRVRTVTELTLAFDHRVCDGNVAAGFLRFVADAMENPEAALADL